METGKVKFREEVREEAMNRKDRKIEGRKMKVPACNPGLLVSFSCLQFSCPPP
jgi:hypothetical protein